MYLQNRKTQFDWLLECNIDTNTTTEIHIIMDWCSNSDNAMNVVANLVVTLLSNFEQYWWRYVWNSDIVRNCCSRWTKTVTRCKRKKSGWLFTCVSSIQLPSLLISWHACLLTVLEHLLRCRPYYIDVHHYLLKWWHSKR